MPLCIVSFCICAKRFGWYIPRSGTAESKLKSICKMLCGRYYHISSVEISPRSSVGWVEVKSGPCTWSMIKCLLSPKRLYTEHGFFIMPPFTGFRSPGCRISYQSFKGWEGGDTVLKKFLKLLFCVCVSLQEWWIIK
jgi:hypothetical protein